MTLTSPANDEARRTNQPLPEIIETRLGPVEYAAFGEGPAVLCLHGAMGGFDQGLIEPSPCGGADLQPG